LKLMPLGKKIGIMKEGIPDVIWDNGETINIDLESKYRHF